MRTGQQRAAAAFTVFGKHAPFLLTLVFLGQLPIMALSAVTPFLTEEHAPWNVAYPSLMMLGALLSAPLWTGALIYALERIGSRGEVEIDEAYRAALPVYERLLRAQVLTFLAVMVGLVLFILPGIYVATRLSLVNFVAVLERKETGDPIPRAWELAKGSLLEVFVVLLLLQAPMVLAANFLSRVFTLGTSPQFLALFSFVVALLTLVGAVIIQTWFYELYRDLRAQSPTKDDGAILFRPIEAADHKQDAKD